MTRVAIPPEIKERYMDITLAIDIVFVNKVEFNMEILKTLNL